jgi:hypothetical protein
VRVFIFEQSDEDQGCEFVHAWIALFFLRLAEGAQHRDPDDDFFGRFGIGRFLEHELDDAVGRLGLGDGRTELDASAQWPATPASRVTARSFLVLWFMDGL